MDSETDPLRRQSAVAGTFFPADADTLMAQAEACITKGAAGWRPEGSCPVAVISPHAGYRYSGWLTGAAWRATARARPDTIVVLSPSHAHNFAGIALPSQKAYAMPGFEVPIDRARANQLVQHGLAHVEDAAHDREHGVETQLAFQHRLHPAAKILPLVIGRTRIADIAALVDHLAQDNAPLFVLSSDLSHFLTLDEARIKDAQTAKLIETAHSAVLTPAHACGVSAIAGFMASRFAQGLRVQRLAMASSADVTGDATRTVGYGAWAMFGTTDEILVSQHRTALLKAARQALTSRTDKGTMPDVNEASFAPALQGYGASFVTLQKDGRLRGCIGSLSAHQPLIRDVVINAVKSGFHDPRFRPVQPDELNDLHLKVAILSPSAPMQFENEDDLLAQLVPERDGLILSDQGKRGVFLPMVWDSLPTPKAFLDGLKVKAGLPKTHWSDTVKIQRFCAETFAEPA